MATSVSLGYCAWLAGATWNDTIGRNLTAGMTFQGATRGGVLPNVANPLQVLASSGMNVTCNPGSAVIPSSSGSAAGPYLPVNNTLQTLTHNAADPTNPRIDLWVIQVVDNGNNTSFGQIAIVAGTPAASPTVPATPTNALPLAQVRVNNGVSSILAANITDVRQFTACAGGIVLCPNMASLPVGWPGLLGYDLTNNRLFQLSASGAGPIHILGFPAASSSITANTAVAASSETTLATVNFTADGVSDYEFTGRFQQVQFPSGTCWLHVRIYLDANLVTDFQLFSSTVQYAGYYRISGTTLTYTTSGAKGTTPSAGAHTVKFAVQPDSASQQAGTVGAASNGPTELYVKQATI